MAAVAAGGTLAAESLNGSIRSFETIAGATLFAPVLPGAWIESGSSAPANAALGAATTQITATGAAAFRAAGDVLLAATGAQDNLFAAGISVEARGEAGSGGAGFVRIDHGASLVAGLAGTQPALRSGAIIANGLTAAADARIVAQGPSLSTAAGAGYDIGGDLTIAVGQDGGGAPLSVTLDNLMAVDTLEVLAEGGTIDIDATAPRMTLNALADDITIASEGDVRIGSVITPRLSVASGGAADISRVIDNAGRTLANLVAIAPAATTEAFSASIPSAGGRTFNAAQAAPSASDFTQYGLGAATAAAMNAGASLVVTETLSLTRTAGGGTTTVWLDNPANLFPASVTVNVNGAVTMFEEIDPLDAATRTYVDGALPEAEAGLLQFADFVAGWDVDIETPDQLQFMRDLALAAGADARMVVNGVAAVILRANVGTTDRIAGLKVREGADAIEFAPDGVATSAAADLTVESAGDIFLFGTIGVLSDGFTPLGAIRLRGNDVIAGAAPEDLATVAPGLIAQTDLDGFVDDLGEVGDPPTPAGAVFGPLGEVIYQVADAVGATNYLVADTLDILSSGGSVLFVIDRANAGAAFAQSLEFFGADLAASVSYGGFGGFTEPARFEMYGAIEGDASTSAGLRVGGPTGTTFFYNGCLVGQPTSCANLGTQISVPSLPLIDLPVFELPEYDVNELFGAIGNEDLWRLPPAYLADEEEEEEDNKESN
jgi:hypothetical protein